MRGAVSAAMLTALFVSGCDCCGGCPEGEECIDHEFHGYTCIRRCDTHSDCPRGERCNLENPVPDSIPRVCEQAGHIGEECEPETGCYLLECIPLEDGSEGGTCQFTCGSEQDSECPDGYRCNTEPDPPDSIPDVCVEAEDA